MPDDAAPGPRSCADRDGDADPRAPGLRADTSAHRLKAAAEDVDTYIVSGDLTGLQLVNDHVRLFTTRMGVSTVVYDDARVMERYEPLTRCSTTEAQGHLGQHPGVPGVGEKTAVAPPAVRLARQPVRAPRRSEGKLGERLGARSLRFLSRKVSASTTSYLDPVARTGPDDRQPSRSGGSRLGWVLTIASRGEAHTLLRPPGGRKAACSLARPPRQGAGSAPAEASGPPVPHVAPNPLVGFGRRRRRPGIHARRTGRAGGMARGCGEEIEPWMAWAGPTPRSSRDRWPDPARLLVSALDPEAAGAGCPAGSRATTGC
jgi:hypothetical protein